MSEINANVVVEPIDLTVTTSNNQIVVTPTALNMNIFTNDSAPGGFPGDLQYNANGVLGGIPTANYVAGNLKLGNTSNVKLYGGANAYFLQTDGTGNLTWAPGTANVSGNGTSAGANNEIQLTDGSGNFKAAPGFTFDTASNLLTAPGNAYVTGNIDSDTNINADGNLVANGNVSGTYILGNGYYLTGIDPSQISNGNTNVKVYANKITFSENGNANVVTIGPNQQMTVTTMNVNSLANFFGAVGFNAAVSISPTVTVDTVIARVVKNANSNITIDPSGNQIITLTSNNIAGGITLDNDLTTLKALSLQSNNISLGRLSNSNATFGISLGYNSGNSNSAINSIAIGAGAGHNDQSTSGNVSINPLGNAIAIGSNAGYSIQGANSVALGANAGSTNQGYSVSAGNIVLGSAIAIGPNAASNQQSFGAIAIGTSAASNNQGVQAVALGQQAAQNWQRDNGVAVGFGAGQTAQGNSAVAIGSIAGQRAQAPQSIAIGANALQNSGANTSNLQSITYATGHNAIAIGFNAGRNNVGNSSIIIGANSGNNANGNSIVIGANSAANIGANSIVIGANAAPTNAGSNVIILNASGQLLTPAYDNSFNVTPIRLAHVPNVTFYNPTTKEITYDTLENYTANISATNANLGNLVVANYFSGNGSLLTGITVLGISNGNSNLTIPNANGNVNISSAGNANVVVVTGTGVNVSGTLDATGNISASYFIGNGSQLTGIDPTAIQNGTANVKTYLNANVAISASGNANILVVTGTGANISGTANVSGNITANVLICTQAGTPPLYVSSSQQVANLRAQFAGTANTANAVNNAAQPNITSVGTLTGLTMAANADIILSGSGSNIQGANIVSANYFSGDGGLLSNIFAPNIANGDSSITIPAANGNIILTANGSPNELVITNSGVNVTGTLNVSSTISAANANITNVTASNVNATILGGNLTTNAQPNITSLGTLSALTVSGNANVNRLIATGNISGTQLISNIATGTAPLVVTSTTVVANLRSATSNVANTVNDAAQPNITSVGTLSSVTVSGNANVNRLIATGNISGTQLISNIPNGTAPLVVSSETVVANLRAATSNIANTVNNNSQPNITSLGTLIDLRINSNVIHLGSNSGGSQSQGAIAIGDDAGNSNQGVSAVAIGNDAGQISQGNYAVALGEQAAANTQGANGIAIGKNAAQLSQGQNSIAIGQGAGYQNQGANSIAIGVGAGNSSQHTNTIILNASSSNLTSTGANQLIIKPIANSRNDQTLVYNTTTGEVSYTNYLKTISTTVGALVGAGTVGAGTRAFVTDANTTTFLAIVGGGGANKVPVVSDGTNWIVG